MKIAVLGALGIIHVFLTGIASFAQPQVQRPMKEGRIYGKVIDAETRKPLEYAVVQVFLASTVNDSVQWKLLSGALTEPNGDFSIDKLPTDKELKLTVNLIGYETLSVFMAISSSGPAIPEKDAGNLRLQADLTLGTVIIEGETEAFRVEFDKRIYDVEKNAINQGGTAEDVMQNIPGLNVDMDGNVTLRNAAPQIFVDGRPTNLSIDQIPADAIQQVEVITNPSARYDASGGGGGIINIVMKKNRTKGYNGSIRAGVDMRPRYNGGFDFNVREGKINVFAGGNLNQRKRLTYGSTDRLNLNSPKTRLSQDQTGVNDGYMARINFGIDWFADNRNTITLNPSLNKGLFQPTDFIDSNTDSIESLSGQSSYTRRSASRREFQNAGTSILYKHLFANEGDELSADISYNRISSEFTGNYTNEYPQNIISQLRQTGDVAQQLGVFQADHVNRVNDRTKFEVGLRAAVRDFVSTYRNYSKNQETGVFSDITALNVNYHFLDQVYATYGNLYLNREKWNYQLGLRLESSDYRAELLDTTLSFRNNYPLSVFPSAFITRVISPTQDLQLAVNRKISRPSFHVLSPFTDYNDSLNVTRGNPGLKPEFTQSAELSYQNSWKKNQTILAAIFMRYSTNLTVSQLIQEYSPILSRDIIITTYQNAATSISAGLELLSQNKINNWFEFTTNLNLFWSSIDGSNIQPGLTNNLTSYWLKTNANIKFPYSFSFQITADYSSRRGLQAAATSRNSIGSGNEGGGPWDASSNTVQGFVRPAYGVDLSLKKDFFKDRRLSVSFAIRDALRTRVNDVYSASPYFTQDTFRRRDPQFWRINLSWRFGKADASLFKRKNMNRSGEGAEG